MNRAVFSFIFVLSSLVCSAKGTDVITGLLERIDRGASRKFVIEQVDNAQDFFELDQKGQRVVVRGNNAVSIATGINWYLKYYAGIHLSWNGMSASLPNVLPPVNQRERHDTQMGLRYDFNYCTHSYTMAFWDWQRWEQEIDWMALHGINLPLTIAGTDCVWRNVLRRLGYTEQEISDYIAGPGFQAWWLMNNLEGWGGPLSDNWYQHNEQLGKRIVARMREYGIEPVLPGYGGMIPHNAHEKLGLNVADPGRWNNYLRPAFLQPTDPRFGEIAALYYEELEKVYGRAKYFSMDPFHEGGNTQGVDMKAAGEAIRNAMKAANPEAVWVIQGWQGNPRPAMIESLPKGDMLVLDLFSESQPQWGDPDAKRRPQGYGHHDWLYCMLLNFGGNVGLHGKMQHLIDEFYKAKDSAFGPMLRGIGMTMEGTENNPVMYELLCELPWRDTKFDRDEWLRGYIKARYGQTDADVEQAWMLLANSIYNCPANNTQQGPNESVFCARPSDHVTGASTWSYSQEYYSRQQVIDAAGLMLKASDKFKGNNNYEYDLVDIMRQAVAEKGRMVYDVMAGALKAREQKWFDQTANRFLQLILLQDRLLATRAEFRVGTWTERARSLGQTVAEKDQYEWNARVQITTWGNRTASDAGRLHDYAHKEWNGLLADFYYVRWNAWIQEQKRALAAKKDAATIDFFAIEEPWTRQHGGYSSQTDGDVIETARRVFEEL